MALPTLIEKKSWDWLFKVTAQNSKQPERDLCLLAFFFGSACTSLELNRIQIRDVTMKSGKLAKSFTVRGNEREVFLSNSRLCSYLTDYLQYRVKNKICLGNHPDHYLGLDPDEGLFISRQNRPFSIVRKKTITGADSYTCDALNRHIVTLLRNSPRGCCSL